MGTLSDLENQPGRGFYHEETSLRGLASKHASAPAALVVDPLKCVRRRGRCHSLQRDARIDSSRGKEQAASNLAPPLPFEDRRRERS